MQRKIFVDPVKMGITPAMYQVLITRTLGSSLDLIQSDSNNQDVSHEAVLKGLQQMDLRHQE